MKSVEYVLAQYSQLQATAVGIDAQKEGIISPILEPQRFELI